MERTGSHRPLLVGTVAFSLDDSLNDRSHCFISDAANGAGIGVQKGMLA